MGRDTNKLLAWIDFIRTGCLILDWLPFRNNCMRTFAFGKLTTSKFRAKTAGLSCTTEEEVLILTRAVIYTMTFILPQT